MQTDTIGLTALALVMIAWLIFGLAFFLRHQINKSHAKDDEAGAKYEPESKWGIALQSVAFAAIWLTPRKHWWALPPSQSAEIAVAIIAVVLAYFSALLSLRAVQTLGKQWTYQARVLKDHDLITQGPYSLVRNPIYLGMFGMLLSTGLVFSHWWLARHRDRLLPRRQSNPHPRRRKTSPRILRPKIRRLRRPRPRLHPVRRLTAALRLIR